eukprot:5058110-Pleurochrysis_carterae.AAC.1
MRTSSTLSPIAGTLRTKGPFRTSSTSTSPLPTRTLHLRSRNISHTSSPRTYLKACRFPSRNRAPYAHPCLGDAAENRGRRSVQQNNARRRRRAAR